MARIDYLDDPHAPAANSIVPAVSAVVADGRGRILLILRTDNNLWSIPGGGIQPGETIKQAARREAKEETGMDCEITGLVGIYSNPGHVAAYDDGEVRQEFSICFSGRISGGSIHTSDESADVRFAAPDQLGDFTIHPSIRLRIQHYLEQRATPYIG